MTIRLLAGDCRDVLPTLPAESVQCCITSPPYYALRSYLDAAHPDKHREIGSEATPDEYLATMVAVFREVRRVLRRDGTCWVNMGDSYSSGARTTQCDPSDAILGKVTARPDAANGGARRAPAGIAKPKDLLLMPARLALALQADGWWVRSDIIWHKPNPMPESCTDRPTSAHEHVFLLTKSGATTFWTHRDGIPGMTKAPPPDYRWIDADDTETDQEPQGWKTQKLPSGKPRWRRINLWRGHDYFYDADAVREEAEYGRRSNFRGGGAYFDQDVGAANGENSGTSSTTRGADPSAGRNLRNVWTIATHAYPDAHFATFPPELAERCIKAGTSERGCCAACGKPWARITDTSYTDAHRGMVGNQRKAVTDERVMHAGRENDVRMDKHVATTGWAPGCQCGTTETRPCVVLDPFIGAGTTALVADRLQRDCIGIDLNVSYTTMAMERCRADAPLFTSFPPAEPPEDERMADLFTDMAAD